MAWSAPSTWTDGVLVTATQLNAQIRDNARYLKGLDGVPYIENAIELPEMATPATPASGRGRMYFKTDGYAYSLNDSGYELLLARTVLPFAQRILNPFPLGSSGSQWGNAPQPWAISIQQIAASVFVDTTNNGSNFWTLTFQDSIGTTLATLSTAAISASTSTRLTAGSITQPNASSALILLSATATGSPGSIIILPAVSYVRTG
jgi:hypothetical protein